MVSLNRDGNLVIIAVTSVAASQRGLPVSRAMTPP